MKIGIFGGTFDPFTDAHEAIVKKVLDEKLVDKVFIVPTVVDYYRNPDDKWLTDDERKKVIRHRDIELSDSGYCVSGWYEEIESHKGVLQESFRKGRRFYNTLVDFIVWEKGWIDDEGYRIGEDKEIGKDYELYTIIGTDQYKNFKSWFMWKELLDLTKLIVVNGRCGDTLGETVGYHEDVPCIEVTIDQKFMFTSATAIRREYKGTEDAVNRYINRQPPLREKLLQNTPIFDLVEKPEVQPGFRPVGINAPDWVTVVIRNKDNFNYLLVRQLRYGTMREYIEFVCGQVENGEDPRETALREVREETGITVNSGFYELGSFDTNPAFMNNKMHYFLCEVTNEDLLSSAKPELDEHEKIAQVWLDGRAMEYWARPAPCCDGGPAYMRLAMEMVKSYDRGHIGKRGN